MESQSASDLKELLERKKTLKTELLIRKAQSDLLAFTKWTKPNYEINWHHRLISQYLQKFVNKEIKRLMIFTPPRHGKSELVSTRLPAFIFGVKPDAQVISVSYSSELAQKNNRTVQRVIDHPSYKAVFPNTNLFQKNIRTAAGGSYLRNSDAFEIVGFRGSYRSAGVTGAVTGMGAEYLLIDDPIKNREEADSPVYREKLWDQWTSTFYTRLEDDGCACVVLTRWHEDDLAGRLIKLAKDEPESDQWTILNLPAIFEKDGDLICPEDDREEGEALWRGKYDEDRLLGIRKTIGIRDFTALYQQRPTAVEGGIIKRKYFQRFWKQLPEKFDEFIQSWDMAFKDSPGSSFVVGETWGRIGADIYLIDQIRDRIGFTDSIAAIRQMTAKHSRALEKLVEDKANGSAIIDTLKKQIPGIVAIKPEGSKESRLSAVEPYFHAGNIILPDPSIMPWVKDYIEELVNFPNAPQTDQVDATTQALLRFKLRAAGNFSKAFIPKKQSTIVRNEDY